MNQGKAFLTLCTVLVTVCISITRSYTFYDLGSNDNLSSKELTVYLNLRRAGEDPNTKTGVIRVSDSTMPLGFYTRRKQNLFPSVEVGPGAFKTEIIEYPSDTLKEQLINLMRLKKQLEEQMG